MELLQDSASDVQGLVTRALSTRIARKQSADFVNGAGTSCRDFKISAVDRAAKAGLLPMR
ncbi:phage major capsid protein [Mycolicibacterium novocastrense]|uniref:phage major capsid protein n=1 Tax=Mycolicibacterium novocastrense TaxID=59813 RepID=UPI0038B3703F